MDVYLMDPFLKDQSGHCYSYLHVLSEKIESLGNETIFVGNELCSEKINETKIHNLFAQEIFYKQKFKLKNQIAKQLNKIILKRNIASFNFGNDFLKILAKLKITKNDIVVINSIRPVHFQELIDCIILNEPNNLPKINIVLHFTSNLKGWTAISFQKQYRKAFKAINSFRHFDRIALFADTDELVKEFKALGASKIQLAPVPVSSITGSNEINERSHSEKFQKIVFSFIGEARREKGFRLLPVLCRLICQQSVRFKIEINVQTGDLNRLSKEDFLIVDELQKLDAHIIPSSLPIDEYNKLLSITDVFLLPYTGLTYQRQSSGIFAEAMAMGKLAIVPGQSWMGQQTSKLFGTAGNEFFYEQIIKSGELKFLDNIENYIMSKHVRKKTWNSENDINRFIQAMVHRDIEERFAPT